MTVCWCCYYNTQYSIIGTHILYLNHNRLGYYVTAHTKLWISNLIKLFLLIFSIGCFISYFLHFLFQFLFILKKAKKKNVIWWCLWFVQRSIFYVCMYDTKKKISNYVLKEVWTEILVIKYVYALRSALF